MTKKSMMKVKGIGKEEKGRLFRDVKGNKDYDEIFYYEDKKMQLLIRQILPQDLEIVKVTRKIVAKQILLRMQDKEGNIIYKTMDKIPDETSNEELIEKIYQADPLKSDTGCFSLIVFNSKTGEFIATMDIEPLDEDYTEGGIQFIFANNKVIESKWGEKLKRKMKSLLMESNVYPKDCKEIVLKSNEYELVPIL